jgi:hypothetical protein
MTGKDLRECALAGSVRSHDGMDFSSLDSEIDPPQDLLAIYCGPQVAYFEHQLFLLPIHPASQHFPQE